MTVCTNRRRAKLHVDIGLYIVLVYDIALNTSFGRSLLSHKKQIVNSQIKYGKPNNENQAKFYKIKHLIASDSVALSLNRQSIFGSFPHGERLGFVIIDFSGPVIWHVNHVVHTAQAVLTTSGVIVTCCRGNGRLTVTVGGQSSSTARLATCALTRLFIVTAQH